MITFTFQVGRSIPCRSEWVKLSLLDDLVRGVTVTIYYERGNPDRSNKELLDRIQNGVDGPFYGPKQPSEESLEGEAAEGSASTPYPSPRTLDQPPPRPSSHQH